MWEKGKRSWRTLIKSGSGYKFSTNTITRNVATPWISNDGLIKSSELGKDKPFGQLQEFLAGISPDLKTSMYETTLGKEKEDHEKNFVEPQVSGSFSDLLNSDIRPFTPLTFLALELGDESGKKAADMFKGIMSELGKGPFVELQQAINNKELSVAQVDALRDKLTAEMEALLGPWAWLLVDIPGLSWLENTVADWAVGEQIESARSGLVEMELSSDFFENLCEDQ